MIFVANYKMNGDKKFYQKVNRVFNKLESEDTVVLCPPFVYMSSFKLRNENVFLGSQDVSGEINKTSTGQISAKMLQELNVTYSIIGHSERREIGETDFMIASKVHMAQEFGLVPIVCVGERNRAESLDILIKQVSIALSKSQKNNVIFAYEPVWAIGTGEIPTVDQINSAISVIKETALKCGFDVQVLYGGSVNLSNHNEIRKSSADGFLMGGVSLKLDDFIKIVKGE